MEQAGVGQPQHDQHQLQGGIGHGQGLDPVFSGGGAIEAPRTHRAQALRGLAIASSSHYQVLIPRRRELNPMVFRDFRSLPPVLAVPLVMLASAVPAFAADPVTLTLKDNRFVPSEVTVPA